MLTFSNKTSLAVECCFSALWSWHFGLPTVFNHLLKYQLIAVWFAEMNGEVRKIVFRQGATSINHLPRLLSLICVHALEIKKHLFDVLQPPNFCLGLYFCFHFIALFKNYNYLWQNVLLYFGLAALNRGHAYYLVLCIQMILLK